MAGNDPSSIHPNPTSPVPDTSRRESASSQGQRRSSTQSRRISRAGNVLSGNESIANNVFGDINLEGFLADENLFYQDFVQQTSYGDPQEATLGHGQLPYYAHPMNPDPNGYMGNDLQQYGHRASVEMTNQPLVALPNADWEPMYNEGSWNGQYHAQQEFADSEPMHQQFYNDVQYPNPVYPAVDYSTGPQSGPMNGYDSLFVGQEADYNSAVLMGPSPKKKRGHSVSQETEYSGPSNKQIRLSDSSSSGSSRRTSGSLDNVPEGERDEIRKSRRMKQRPSAIVPYKPGEKPKTDENKPWIRINNTTKGVTSRTSKINNYVPPYDQHLPPLISGWSSTHFSFNYTKDGQFAEQTMAASQIREFILEYPSHNPKAKLKLWIQKCPTDSSRRYISPNHSKCRFRNCPAWLYEKGTIVHGHYRVAFDEVWHSYRQNANPFHMTGYVHLFCMEQFLDFPDICRKADVEVDMRSFTTEPKGAWPTGLHGQPEGIVAAKFIEACKRKTLWDQEMFQDYPKHENYRGLRGERKRKPHEHTLTFHMTYTKATHRAPAQIQQFTGRGLKETQICVNMGDLDRHFRAKVAAKEAKKTGKKKGKRKAQEAFEDEESDMDTNIKRSKGTATESGARLQFTPRPRKKKSRSPPQYQPWDDDEDEFDPFEYDMIGSPSAPPSHVSPPRPSSLRSGASPRLRSVPPKNYNEDHLLDMESVPYHGYQQASQEQNIDPQLHNQPDSSDPGMNLAAIQDYNARMTRLPSAYNPIEHNEDIAKDLGLDFDLQRRRSSVPSRLSSISFSRKSSLRQPSATKKYSISSEVGERRKSVQWTDQVKQTRSRSSNRSTSIRHSERIARRNSQVAGAVDNVLSGRVEKNRRRSSVKLPFPDQYCS